MIQPGPHPTNFLCIPNSFKPQEMEPQDTQIAPARLSGGGDEDENDDGDSNDNDNVLVSYVMTPHLEPVEMQQVQLMTICSVIPKEYGLCGPSDIGHSLTFSKCFILVRVAVDLKSILGTPDVRP